MPARRIWVGCSGWNYPDWLGAFYPPEVPRRAWLSYYSSVFGTVELNFSFYRLPLEKTLARWNLEGGGTLWSCKVSRYITHIKRLRDCAAALDTFFTRMSALERRGPALFQLPPSLRYDPGLFRDFAALLPRGWRCAVEPRHESWFTGGFLDSLASRNIALCVSDTAGRYPYREAVTADFAYLRLHGHERLYESLYSEKELAAWARKLRGWGRETFVYFDNTMGGNAPANARRLGEIVSRPG